MRVPIWDWKVVGQAGATGWWRVALLSVLSTSSSSLPEAVVSAARCLGCLPVHGINIPLQQRDPGLGLAVYPGGQGRPRPQTSAKSSWPFKLFILRISLGLPQGPTKRCGY